MSHAAIGRTIIAGCLLASSFAAAAPLVIGETFTLPSEVLGEARRINVFRPTFYGERIEGPLPVLYMPDGGVHEDFLHIAGLLQISVANGSMRPFLLVGIENTERRRDLTGPSADPEDRKIAPRVGGSADFRRFLAEELFPEIERRHKVTAERAIIGESLAGLFVVETLLRAPGLFDIHIAVDPSLWWNREALVKGAADPRGESLEGTVLYVTTSGEGGMAEPAQSLVDAVRARGAQARHERMPQESHATVYHPAALAAFRAVLQARQAE